MRLGEIIERRSSERSADQSPRLAPAPLSARPFISPSKNAHCRGVIAGTNPLHAPGKSQRFGKSHTFDSTTHNPFGSCQKETPRGPWESRVRADILKSFSFFYEVPEAGPEDTCGSQSSNRCLADVRSSAPACPNMGLSP